jgi:hypothetical protein
MLPTVASAEENKFKFKLSYIYTVIFTALLPEKMLTTVSKTEEAKVTSLVFKLSCFVTSLPSKGWQLYP